MSSVIVRLALLGMSSRLHDRFELLFESTVRGLAHIVNESVADAALVDLDSPGSAAALQAFRATYPGRPVVVVALKPPALSAPDESVRKPVRIRDLVIALQRIQARLENAEEPASDLSDCATTSPESLSPPERTAGTEPRGESAVVKLHGDAGSERTEASESSETTPNVDREPVSPLTVQPTEQTAEATHPAPKDVNAPTRGTADRAPGKAALVHPVAHDPSPSWAALCGERDDTDPEDATATRELWYPTEKLLLDHLTKSAGHARRERSALSFACNGLAIILDGSSDCAMSNRSAEEVASRCSEALGPAQVTSVSAQTASRLAAACEARWRTIDSLIWSVALWTYRGRLPLGTSLNKKVYLAQWPNFTRLEPLPDAMRIAALWTEQPMSIAFTAEALGIPQRHVIAFYGAANALGLAGPALREADALFAAEPISASRERPLIGRILKRLRGLIATDFVEWKRTSEANG